MKTLLTIIRLLGIMVVEKVGLLLRRLLKLRVCDVCDRLVAGRQGFLLTTQQVVSEPSYWRCHILKSKNQWLFSTEDTSGHSLLATVKKFAGYATPWLVCEQCISIFPVDRADARSRCLEWWSSGASLYPAGYEAGDLADAMRAAATGWFNAFARPWRYADDLRATRTLTDTSPPMRSDSDPRVRTLRCPNCGTEAHPSAETPPFGTVLACTRCQAPLFQVREEPSGVPAYCTPRAVLALHGYAACSLEHPQCPQCGKTNYNVVFPDNGYAIPWYARQEPKNPKSFIIDVKCIWCARAFVVEWDTFPIEEGQCNYCGLVCGGSVGLLLESNRQGFEHDYGQGPQLRSQIKNGASEPLWLTCPRCMDRSRRHRLERPSA